MKKKNKFLNFIFRCCEDFVFSPICFYCEKICHNGDLICQDCQSFLKDSLETEGKFVKIKNNYFRSYALYGISARTRKMVYGIKYNGAANLIKVFFAQAEMDWRWFSDCLLVPVPLHSARLRERGYNQAKLIANELARCSGGKVADVLKRTKYTKSQTGFSKEKRAKNMQSVISTKSSIEKIYGKKIIVVDDVYTTGATVGACIKKIQEHDAAWIGIFSLLRAGDLSEENDFLIELKEDLFNRN